MPQNRKPWCALVARRRPLVAGELVQPLPPSLRKAASQPRRYGRKKKQEPKPAVKSEASLAPTVETPVESGASLALPVATPVDSGPSLDSTVETSVDSGPSADLPLETSVDSGPSLDLTPHTPLKSGPSLGSRMTKRRRGEKRRLVSSTRRVPTPERTPMTTETPRGFVETEVSAPPEAACIPGNGDLCRLHEASLRGNRRPSASVRGGNRAKRWLKSPACGVDTRFGGPQSLENGGFRVLRPLKEKILGIFAR